MKLLIIFASKEGQTEKICKYLEALAKENNVDTVISDVNKNFISPNGFDIVLVAGSIHGGTYQKNLKKYVEKYSTELNNVPITAFITVSLTAAGEDINAKSELKDITSNFLNQVGWNPDFVEQVAGALRYSKYNFFVKLIMKYIARKSGGSTDTSKDHEYTDWKQVKKFFNKITDKETTV